MKTLETVKRVHREMDKNRVNLTELKAVIRNIRSGGEILRWVYEENGRWIRLRVGQNDFNCSYYFWRKEA